MGGITVEVAITPLVFDDRRSTASGAVGIPFGATTGVPPRLSRACTDLTIFLDFQSRSLLHASKLVS